MSDARSLTLLGGPESGKSTYLGVLADALDRDALRGLRRGPDPDDMRVWDKLTEPLLDAAYPQRTKAERLELVLPMVLEPASGLVDAALDFTLRVGDYDGEEVERLFRNRTAGWSEEWRARAQAAGLLLFVRPDTLRTLPRLRSDEPPPDEMERWRRLQPDAPAPAPAAALPAAPGPEAYFGSALVAEEVPRPSPARPDDPVHIPTALAIVELIQFIRHTRGLAPGERPADNSLRVALLVTAWDSLDERWQKLGPAGYLSETMPLVDDFLWSNFHEADVFRFGLSATGGDLRDPTYRERYREEPGGYVVWNDATGATVRKENLSTPLQWALFGDRALHPDEHS